jgi:hypothetical protein
MTSEPAPALPRVTKFGPYKRIVEPDRHVYYSRMSVLRGVIATLCILACGGVAFASRVILNDAELRNFLAAQCLLGLFLACSPVFIGILLLVLVAAVRLTITPRTITVFDRNFIGRTRARTWRLEEIESIQSASSLTFNVASTSVELRARLGFTDGREEILRYAFDDRRSFDRFVRAVTNSIVQMGERDVGSETI